MENGDFLEQREQSDACISYAESRQNWAKPMVNGQWSTFNVQCSMFNEEETGGISLADVIEAFYDCLKRKRNTLNALEFEMDFERNCLDL